MLVWSESLQVLVKVSNNKLSKVRASLLPKDLELLLLSLESQHLKVKELLACLGLMHPGDH